VRLLVLWQGLVEEWNFNQRGANAAFKAALQFDRNCSRCWWGIAYSLGPGANRDVLDENAPYPCFSPEDFPETQAAAQEALALARQAAAANPSSKALHNPQMPITCQLLHCTFFAGGWLSTSCCYVLGRESFLALGCAIGNRV
jgi:hypothetical protein